MYISNSDNLPYAFCEQIGKEIRDISDEIPFEIPDSWEWCRWGELSQSIQYGYNAPAKQAGRIKMVRISDIQDNKVLWDSVPYCDIDESDIDTYLLQANDILFARTGGTVGKSYLVKDVPEDAIYAGYLIRTRYSNSLCPEYLKFFMESELYWTQLRNGTIATAQPNCNGKTLSNMIVPVPPLSEQHRIVAKIEELLPYIERYGKAEEHLTALNTTFPEALKKSILQEAVQGKLVPQNPDDEPASVLLERIRAEKQELIKAGKIKKDKHESVIVTRDKIPYEIIDGKERCIADEVPFEIPDNWCWCRLGEIGETNIGLTYRPSDKTDSSGVLVLRSSNIQNGQIDYNDNVYVSCDIPERALIHKGDILICARNGSRALVGKCALVDKDGMAFGAFMAKFSSPYNQYIKVFLDSPLFRQQLEGVKTETINQITQDVLKKQLIPFPPLAEQKRIVAKIEELMQYCDKL